MQSFSWRSDGCTLASTCKDRQLRVFDVRTATVTQVIIIIVVVVVVDYALIRVTVNILPTLQGRFTMSDKLITLQSSW